MTGTFYVAKLQTATPDMFGFPVSVMILVMVVLGGIGSVWGVVLGAILLQLLQSWFLGSTCHSGSHALGTAIGVRLACSTVDLTQAIELIFGIILVADDAVPPRRADPGDAPQRGADLRAAACRGAAPAAASRLSQIVASATPTRRVRRRCSRSTA